MGVTEPGGEGSFADLGVPANVAQIVGHQDRARQGADPYPSEQRGEADPTDLDVGGAADRYQAEEDKD